MKRFDPPDAVREPEHADSTPVTIVDYGVGNIQALINMLAHIGVDAAPSSSPVDIADARKLLLPGVGAFDRAMRALHEKGLVSALADAVIGRRVPVLGVCLGMQLMAKGSEEGDEAGLGWIDAEVRKLRPPAGSLLKVPNVGWSLVTATKPSLLFDRDSTTERFYFVHSFYVSCASTDDIAATVEYGGPICCAVSRGSIHGVQFHPEKSHRFGMRVLRAFASNAGVERTVA